MKPILLGVTVYGERHVDTFLKYTWPSLMSAGNIDALRKERDVGVIIHTDEKSAPLLRNVPFPFLDVVAGKDKYEQLGRHQNIDLWLAKEQGADYHCLMPDYVYSENCFTGVLAAVKRGHKAIARLVVSTVQETICPLLRPNISAVDLATLSLQHIHPGVRGWLADKDGYPNTHVVAWEGKDTLTMCSPHCSPVYIANEAIGDVSGNLPLDCILDKVIIGDIYCPKPEDGIVMIEMTPRANRRPNDGLVDLDKFCWNMRVDTKDSMKQKQLFDNPTIDPIDRSKLGSEYWSDVDISEQRRILRDAIIGGSYA